MTLSIAAALLVAVFFTSMLSGIFGMAGGLVLLGVLLAILPVGTAIAVQGAIQIVANGSRALFSRDFIDWKILGIICLGIVAVGVAGPTIDMFFIRTPMDRRTIIATKAAAQVVNHAGKVLFYWNATMVLTGWEWGAVALAAPFAVLGTSAGYWVLQRLTDANFKSWTRLLVTAIGIYYLIRGLTLLI